jgi:hypothetical protein
MSFYKLKKKKLNILSRVRVIYKTGFGLDDWINCHLIQTTRDYRQYSTIAILHTLQFTVAHGLGFSVFTSLILATDCYWTQCNFKSRIKSSLHRLISFLPFLLNYLRLPSQNSTQFPSDSCAPSTLTQLPLAATSITRPNSLPTTVLYSPLLLLLGRVFRLCNFITTWHGPHRKQSSTAKDACLLVRYLAIDFLLLSYACCGNVFTEPSPSNWYTRHNILKFTITQLLKSNLESRRYPI